MSHNVYHHLYTRIIYMFHIDHNTPQSGHLQEIFLVAIYNPVTMVQRLQYYRFPHKRNIKICSKPANIYLFFS